MSLGVPCNKMTEHLFTNGIVVNKIIDTIIRLVFNVGRMFFGV